jgi:hypothetical protein
MKLISILTCALAVFGLPGSANASAAAGAALNTLKSMDYRFFVAGGTCAAISHGITCPIDVVKVSTLSIFRLDFLLHKTNLALVYFRLGYKPIQRCMTKGFTTPLFQYASRMDPKFFWLV